MVKEGDELKNKKPFLRVEEVLKCKDGRELIKVRPFYESQALNDKAESKVFFLEELKEQGRI